MTGPSFDQALAEAVAELAEALRLDVERVTRGEPAAGGARRRWAALVGRLAQIRRVQSMPWMPWGMQCKGGYDPARGSPARHPRTPGASHP